VHLSGENLKKQSVIIGFGVYENGIELGNYGKQFYCKK
jgi:hypothetical protein